MSAKLVGFLEGLSTGAALRRADEEAILQTASDLSTTQLVHAQLVERDAFDLCMSLFPNSDPFQRASKLLDKATKACQKHLAEWQPTERQRRTPQ